MVKQISYALYENNIYFLKKLNSFIFFFHLDVINSYCHGSHLTLQKYAKLFYAVLAL